MQYTQQTSADMCACAAGKAAELVNTEIFEARVALEADSIKHQHYA